MTGTPLNRQYIYPGNDCFGCGPDNPQGLRIEIHRDGDRTDRLVGVFRPRPTAAGFPGVAHGGAQFAALDCMPLTTTAAMRFEKAARVAEELALSAEIVKEAEGKAPFTVKTAIRDAKGEILSEADFDYVLVPQGKCPPPDHRGQHVAGLDRLPQHYVRHFGVA